MSSSSSRAVSMMIGTELSARRRLQTSSPSSFGSIRSSTTRSTSSSANRASASSPSSACTTRNPSRSSGYVSSFCTESSSSTSRMVAGSAMVRRPGVRPADGRDDRWPGLHWPCHGAAQTSARVARAPTPRLRRAADQRPHGAREPGCSSRCRSCSPPSRSAGRSRCRRRRSRPRSTQSTAEQLAASSARDYPDRSPGSAGGPRGRDVAARPADALRHPASRRSASRR